MNFLNEKKIKDFFIDLLISYPNLDFKENYNLFIDYKTNKDTAYWFYKPPHNIAIGSDILNNIKKNIEDTKLKNFYIKSFLKHEISHSLWTANIENIVNLLNKINIPFHYFNLFEDARIEEKFRVNTKEFFKWTFLEKLELMNEKFATPLEIFYYFIFSENEEYIEEIDNKTVKIIKEMKYFENIKDFYLRTINSKNSFDLLPIIKEFLEKYKNELDENKNNLKFITFISEFDGLIKDGEYITNEKDIEDLQEGLSLVAEINLESNKPIDNNDNDDDLMDNNDFVEEQIFLIQNIQQQEIKSSINNKLDMKHPFIREKPVYSDNQIKNSILKGEEIFNYALKKIFKLKMNKVLKEKVSKEFDVNRLILDEEKLYKHKIQSRKGKKGKKKELSLVIDLSGSMNGISLKILTVLYVFIKLEQLNIINLNVFLSGGINNKSISLKLPKKLQALEIYKITFNCGFEAIYHTINNNLKDLQKSDLIFILTDGQITDKPIDKEELHKKGIYTNAIYTFPVKVDKKFVFHIEKNLNKYFDEFILKETVKEIFEEIIIKYKN